jgi:hypothetical protein
MVTNLGGYDFAARPRRVRVAVSAAILGLAVLATSTGSATAQGYRGTQDAQSACTPDVFRLCQQFIPNRGPIVACLIRYRAYLSPACRAVFGGPTRVAKAKKTGKSRKARRAKRAR